MSSIRGCRKVWAVMLLVATVVGMLLAPRPAIAATRDITKPKVTLTTADGAVLVGPTDATGMRVTGTVTDNRRVRGVTLFALGERNAVVVGSFFMEFTETELICARAGRSCSWSADVPFETGEWTLYAVATDTAGNKRRTPRIHVTVVTIPPLAPV